MSTILGSRTGTLHHPQPHQLRVPSPILASPPIISKSVSKAATGFLLSTIRETTEPSLSPRSLHQHFRITRTIIHRSRVTCFRNPHRSHVRGAQQVNSCHNAPTHSSHFPRCSEGHQHAKYVRHRNGLIKRSVAIGAMSSVYIFAAPVFEKAICCEGTVELRDDSVCIVCRHHLSMSFAKVEQL